MNVLTDRSDGKNRVLKFHQNISMFDTNSKRFGHTTYDSAHLDDAATH